MKITFTTSDFKRQLCNEYPFGISDMDIYYIIDIILSTKMDGVIYIFEESALSKLNVIRLTYIDSNNISCLVEKSLVYKHVIFNIIKNDILSFNKFKNILNFLVKEQTCEK
jgi:hypothetical protein